jgi:hypothetical protein
MPDVEPTPDAIREPPGLRTSADTYVVQPGDSLNRIAGQFGVSAESILRGDESGGVLFRMEGQANPSVDESLRLFREVIRDYFGARATRSRRP